MESEFTYYWAVQLQGKQGYIYFSDSGAREKAESSLKKSLDMSLEELEGGLENGGSAFLEMVSTKGEGAFGIHVFRGKFNFPNMEDMKRFLSNISEENKND